MRKFVLVLMVVVVFGCISPSPSTPPEQPEQPGQSEQSGQPEGSEPSAPGVSFQDETQIRGIVEPRVGSSLSDIKKCCLSVEDMNIEVDGNAAVVRTTAAIVGGAADDIETLWAGAGVSEPPEIKVVQEFRLRRTGDSWMIEEEIEVEDELEVLGTPLSSLPTGDEESSRTGWYYFPVKLTRDSFNFPKMTGGRLPTEYHLGGFKCIRLVDGGRNSLYVNEGFFEFPIDPVYPLAEVYDTKIYAFSEKTAWLDEERGVVSVRELKMVLEAIEFERWHESLFGRPWEGEECEVFEVVEKGTWRIIEPFESHVEIVVK